jgi:transglutaminase-like putative cysteine protease
MVSAYLKKLIDFQFKDLSDMRWYETIVMWCINSKFRKYKRLDFFLNDQVNNPDPELLKLANALRTDNPYTTVSKIEEYVIRNFYYKFDSSPDGFNMQEYWATAKEILKNRWDDCDGLNSLIWILCYLAGIDNDMIYCVLGDTATGYHFWVIFFDARRSRMVKLDATYYPKVNTIAKKAEFKLGSRYKKIDYIFNNERIYAFR